MEGTDSDTATSYACAIVGASIPHNIRLPKSKLLKSRSATEFEGYCSQRLCKISIRDRNSKAHYLPSSPGVKIKSRQLLACILHILLRLHAHIKYRAILARTDDLVMQTSLAPLALRP